MDIMVALHEIGYDVIHNFFAKCDNNRDDGKPIPRAVTSDPI
jgi:hypothetical protein